MGDSETAEHCEDPAIKCLSHKAFRHIISIAPVRQVHPHLEGQTGITIVQLPGHRTRLLHKYFGSPSREIVLPQQADDGSGDFCSPVL